MNVRRFEAPDMARACELIRAELGPDALIISSRKKKAGGLGGVMGREVIEVVAGLAEEPALAAAAAAEEPTEVPAVIQRATRALRASAATDTQRAASDGAASVRISAAAHQAAARAAIEEATAPSAPARPPSAALIGAPQSAAAAVEAGGALPAAPADLAGVAADIRGARREIGELRRLVQDLAAARRQPERDLPSGAREVIDQLRGAGVSEALLAASSVAAAAVLDAQASRDSARQAIGDALLALFPAGPFPPLEHGKSTVIHLLGPSGAGKTLTAVRLALRISQTEGHPVVLANADTQRPGAAQQVQAYGEALGLPTAQVYEPSDLKALTAQFPGAVIVVDSEGRLPRTAAELASRKGLVAAVRRRQVLLTLPACASAAALAHASAAFRSLPVTGMVLTKTDETDQCGEALSFLHTAAAPLQFLTHGTDARRGLEAGGVAALLDLILHPPVEAIRGESLAS